MGWHDKVLNKRLARPCVTEAIARIKALVGEEGNFSIGCLSEQGLGSFPLSSEMKLNSLSPVIQSPLKMVVDEWCSDILAHFRSHVLFRHRLTEEEFPDLCKGKGPYYVVVWH